MQFRHCVMVRPNVEVTGAALLYRAASLGPQGYAYFGAGAFAAFSANTCSIAFLISVSDGDFKVK